VAIKSFAVFTDDAVGSEATGVAMRARVCYFSGEAELEICCNSDDMGLNFNRGERRVFRDIGEMR